MPASLDAWDERLRSVFGLSLMNHPERLRDGLRTACTAVGLDDDAELLARLDHGDHETKAALACALTIGETYFFREPHHFDLLREHLLPAAVARGCGPVVMVSAACSSGEEAYSMAICARQVLGRSANGAAHVLGFDVNEGAVHAARRGHYRAWSMRGMSDDVRQRWFDPVDDAWGVVAQVRSLTTFERRNLVDAVEAMPPASADIVFCRNVLIYFDEPSVVLALTRLAESLRPHGTLVVSSAEGALFATAGLGCRQMGDAWVHTRGETRSPDFSSAPSLPAAVGALPRPPRVPSSAPVASRRGAVDSLHPPGTTDRATARHANAVAPATARPTTEAARVLTTEAARVLDHGWGMLAVSPDGAAEQARRAILLDRTLPAAHLLAASAAFAREDVRGARTALRHARRYLARANEGDVLQGGDGATAGQMLSYCARLERALAGRDE